MTIGVYGIFIKKTNECLYIGQSSNIEERWYSHRYLLKSHKHIRKDFNQWFIDNGESFDKLNFVVLEKCDNSDNIKNKLEIFYFKLLKPKFYGKEPSINEKWKHTEKTKDKISQSSISKKYLFLEENKELIIDMAKNKSIAKNQACKEMNISLFLLKKFLKVNGITWNMKLQKIDSDDFAKLEYLLFEQKMSTRQIAKIFNVSQPAVMSHIAKIREDPRYEEFKNKDLKKFQNRNKGQIAKKNLAESECEYCGAIIKINTIKQHKVSCRTFPRCLCGKKLSKRSAKQCISCYRRNT